MLSAMGPFVRPFRPVLMAGLFAFAIVMGLAASLLASPSGDPRRCGADDAVFRAGAGNAFAAASRDADPDAAEGRAPQHHGRSIAPDRPDDAGPGAAVVATGSPPSFVPPRR